MSRALATREPEYRALMMFEEVPEGCITFLCSDDFSEPHIKAGEFVLVDTRDTSPRNGEVYVIQWQSGRRCICQASITPGVKTKMPGETEWSNEPQWTVHSLKRTTGRAIAEALRAATSSGRSPVLPGWCEGWFDTNHLQEKLVGHVIGLYSPQYEGPRREDSE